ncbi:hypothetical protein I5U42_12860 [Stenotrophomonas maltophilia]|nr:hypothetical protein [Stenotrophomonas maltophilia]
MGLIAGPTKWILLLSGAHDAVELRHVQDLAYGVFCLERAGVRAQDIAIYVDGGERRIANLATSFAGGNYEVKPCSCFFEELPKLDGYENLVVFVTGHGSPLGIDGDPPITPTMMLEVIRSVPKLERAMIYLGQCFAGVFNYVGAGNRFHKDRRDVIFMGATSLHESISSSTSEEVSGGRTVSWVANLFLLYVFKWIMNPVDIDGDGKFTVIDSYKYAGAMANYANKRGRSMVFDGLLELREKMSFAAKELASGEDVEGGIAKKVEYDALAARYRQMRDVHFIHQDCWILNAVPAQSIEVY